MLSERLPATTRLEPAPFELLANRLCEAGCDDCVPATCEGVVTINFAREAASLGKAIDTAVAAIRNSGYTPVEVHCEQLVDVLLGSKEQAIS